MIPTIIFYSLSVFLIIASIAVISVKNPVHSVFSLIICFILTAGLFILIGAEYIALSLIIIYVGAIAVLFLFVVMMLDINFTVLRQGWLSYMPFCLIIAGILGLDLYLLFEKSLKKTIDFNYRALPINELNSLTNTEMIGEVLYTDYMLPFQIAGLLLLVAMIGAIVLTLRTRTNVKRQITSKQLERTKEDGLILVKVKTGEDV